MFMIFIFISANNHSNNNKKKRREKRYLLDTHIYRYCLCDDVSWLDADFMISDISFIIMYDLRHCVLLGVFNNLFHFTTARVSKSSSFVCLSFDSPMGFV